MSIKTPQEKVAYARQMLKETQGWAGKTSPQAAFWKKQIKVLKLQVAREET